MKKRKAKKPPTLYQLLTLMVRTIARLQKAQQRVHEEIARIRYEGEGDRADMQRIKEQLSRIERRLIARTLGPQLANTHNGMENAATQQVTATLSPSV